MTDIYYQRGQWWVSLNVENNEDLVSNSRYEMIGFPVYSTSLIITGS